MAAKPICRGKETFISFFTPDSDVNVDDPVKFIARNEEIAVMMKNQDPISKILFPVKFNDRSVIKTRIPDINPFKEKGLPGMYGRNIGVITIPER